MKYVLLMFGFMSLAACAHQERQVASDVDEPTQSSVMSHLAHPKAGI
jgi:hypothetical protein